MPEHFFDELKRYVGFTVADEERLRALAPQVRPFFERIVADFYARIEEHAGARAVMSGPAQTERLRRSMVLWLEGFFTGPWDHAYFEHRTRIGHKHVEIRLPQHYMLTGMSIMRQHVVGFIAAAGDAEEVADLCAVERLFDVELAIMLDTYQEDHMRQLARRERLATFGELTSTIGHELRNPLGVIESSIFLLRKKVNEDPGVQRHLDRIQDQVQRSNRIITSMLDIVRERPPTLYPSTPRTLVEKALDSLPEAQASRVQMQVADDLPRVRVDAAQVQQLLVNLLINAVEASGPAGRVEISVTTDGTHVTFLVNDDGPGVELSVRARLFEPLVTTKHTGVGLGLALCRKIAMAHGGTLSLTQGRLSGAAFAFQVPAATGSAV